MYRPFNILSPIINKVVHSWIYGRKVKKLPDKPGIEDVESTVDEVCELLSKYTYTRQLLKNLHGKPNEKGLTSPSKTLKDSEELVQICNTMQSLSQEASLTKQKAKKRDLKSDSK